MSLSLQAYENIKRKIVFLELEPGSVIDEAGLQAELELGRTPIREALQRLEWEQLVTIVPRRGMFVTDISVNDLHQIFELRLTMEALATQLAAQRGTPAHWQQMDDVLQSHDWDSATDQQLIEIDEMCHTIIYAAADNHFLQDTLTSYYALSLRLWYFFLHKIGDMRTAIQEHQQIYEALSDGDSDEAARLMQQHIHSFQIEIQAIMLGVSV
ncbi:MAG: GntR family transcriptional regulator [Chloroflexi bacterium]|nr:GntR family transcriptional regulator [Chloroflexota bacterium]